MLVILRENIEHLGLIGDVVNVKDGYARNFLLPRKLVVQADKANVEQLNHYKTQFEKRRLEQKGAAEELAKKLGEFSCTISRKVGKGDKLFGSVSSQDIADELIKAGYTSVKKSMVHVKDAIKSLGVHPVTVKLQPDVQASVKVWVVKDET